MLPASLSGWGELRRTAGSFLNSWHQLASEQRVPSPRYLNFTPCQQHVRDRSLPACCLVGAPSKLPVKTNSRSSHSRPQAPPINGTEHGISPSPPLLTDPIPHSSSSLSSQPAMSVRPIITFKAGICEVDVSPPKCTCNPHARTEWLTHEAAIQQAIQGEAITTDRLHLPLSSFRRW